MFGWCGFMGILFSVGPPGGAIVLFFVFTGILFSVGPPGGAIVLFFVFTGILFSVGPSGTPSFVARRKIGEKGVPKGSKAALWILAFYTGVRRGDVPT